MTLKTFQLLPWYECELPYEHGAVRVIEDSINPNGDRLTTFETIFWRPILGENNTQRSNSKNSSSNRAQPLRGKDGRPGTLDVIENSPAEPLHWGSAKPGMQSGESLLGDDLEAAQKIWREHREFSIKCAEELDKVGLHKSVTNRLLEAHQWVRMIQSSTDWDATLRLRSSYYTPDAQAEFAVYADAIFELLDYSNPVFLQPGDWHLPLVTPEERIHWNMRTLREISVARCGRTSYLTGDRTLDPVADMGLYQKFVDADPFHASPFEHVATPLSELDAPKGNFKGWRQFRHIVEQIKHDR